MRRASSSRSAGSTPTSTGTGYRVAPLVALIDPAFALTLNPEEVADAFETPFAFLMDPANHRLEERNGAAGRENSTRCPTASGISGAPPPASCAISTRGCFT